MYYSGNRWLTLEEMKVNAQFVYDYLSPLGWTKNAIAGILGNMQTESSINPAIWQNLDEGNTDLGFGLVQWTPATKYLDWCTANGLTFTLMESNLARVLYEVTNDLQWGNDSDGNPPPYSFETFTHSTQDAYTLGMYFLWYYERPAVKNQPIRGTQANYWFTFLKGTKKKFKAYLYANKKRRFIFS